MIRNLSLFTGIGAFEKALKNINIPTELIGYSEVDKYASKAYSLIHGESELKNLGDITKIDVETLPNNIDLITYGFPCQDISVAGKGKGFTNDKGELTRSGLFFYAAEIIKEKQPKIAIAENVKNLLSKKFSNEFNAVLKTLENAGYNNYYQVLNAKNYGIPQNRDRVFIISIRKDIDNGKFKFPEPFELEKKLRDLLEKEVDEKYYLSDEKVMKLLNSTLNQEKGRSQSSDVCGTLCARDYKGPKCVPIFQNNDMVKLEVRENTKKGYTEAYEGDSINIEFPNSKTRRGRVGHGLAQTLTTKCNQAVVPPVKNYKNRIKCVTNLPFIAASRGRNQENPSTRTQGLPTKQVLEFNVNGTSNTLTTVQKDNYVICEQRSDEGLRFFKNGICGTLRTGGAGGNKRILQFVGNIHPSGRGMNGRVFCQEGICPTITTGEGPKVWRCPRIRRLTPKECFRLMGFNDEDVDALIRNGISNTQLYKMAGNSIVVNVLEEIFKELIKSQVLEVGLNDGGEYHVGA